MYVPDKIDDAIWECAGGGEGEWPMPPETVVQRLADELRMRFGKPSEVRVVEDDGRPWQTVTKYIKHRASISVDVSYDDGVLSFRKADA